ncbi:RNA-binding S4 domain-containing protein [Pseudoalteromonas fenneropenaei]|uniref:RNA-binding S4 domain-containing protein n=1 Tax=Pseudoalteromonas fenneropenaei TaxID=1737459 RepID=A0ABV7CM36_9GAMM
MYEIELEEEPIELCNLLKLIGIADTGGQAKMLIAEGYVHLNGELCTLKRKKIYAGDQFEVNDESFVVSLAAGVTPAERKVATPHTEPQGQPVPSKAAKTPKHKQRQSNIDKKTGRKPISFG